MGTPLARSKKWLSGRDVSNKDLVVTIRVLPHGHPNVLEESGGSALLVDPTAER